VITALAKGQRRAHRRFPTCEGVGYSTVPIVFAGAVGTVVPPGSWNSGNIPVGM
jgi:hypothetical protein